MSSLSAATSSSERGANVLIESESGSKAFHCSSKSWPVTQFSPPKNERFKSIEDARETGATLVKAAAYVAT
jgi:hypothetical protein